MRHLVDHRKLGVTTPHRLAMLRNMAGSLIQHGRIETTLPKAKELRRVADRLVTLGKRGSLEARRRARRWIQDQVVLAKLFNELAPRFSSRPGGYTRILKLNFRQGDQAPMALIEYVDNPPPLALKGKSAKKEKTKEKPKKTKEKKEKKRWA